MSSKTDIANMALAHVGIGKPIANLETEQSREATACRTFYDVAREATLNDAPWPFSTLRRTLALVEEDPNDEWDFSYRYPSDCLQLRRVLSGLRNDTPQSRTPYKIEQDDEGKLIFTDMDEAIVEYTARVTDTTLFTAGFVIALSFRIASYIAPMLTAGDPFKLQNQTLQLYRYELSRANATAFNEEQPDEPPEAELIRARG